MIKIISEMFRTYPIPLVLALVAWIPVDFVLGILFSPHGGLGWLILLVSFPWLIVRIIVLCVFAQPDLRPPWKRALALLLGYLPISILSSYSLVFALSPPLTNSLRNVLPWFYFPLSVAISHW